MANRAITILLRSKCMKLRKNEANRTRDFNSDQFKTGNELLNLLESIGMWGRQTNLSFSWPIRDPLRY